MPIYRMSRQLRRLTSLLVLVLMVTACASSAPGPAGQKTPPPKTIQLSVGTTNSSSSWYAYWSGWVQGVNPILAEKGIQANIIESGSSVDNIKRMGTGEFNLGMTASDAAYVAYNGKQDWEPQTNIRWLWSLGHTLLLVIVSADSGVNDLSDLHGKKFSAGDVGSGSFKGTKAVLGALGIEPDYYLGSFSDAVDAMKNREIVGMTKMMPGRTVPDSQYLDVMSAIDTKFLNVTSAQEKIILENFNMYTILEVPPGVYSGQTEPARTWSGIGGASASKDLPQDVVYEIMKATEKARGSIVEAFPAYAGIDFVNDIIVPVAAIPLHSGVVQFLKEKGVTVPQALIPPEYKE